MGRRGNRRGGGQGRDQEQGQGSGRMGGPFAAGPGGECVCPECGHKIEHVVGKPCNQQKCPKCSAQMNRR
jgi:hypothetical protein